MAHSTAVRGQGYLEKMTRHVQVSRKLSALDISMLNMHYFFNAAENDMIKALKLEAEGNTTLSQLIVERSVHNRLRSQACARDILPYTHARKTAIKIKMDDPESMSDAELIEYLAEVPEIESVIEPVVVFGED